MRRLYALVTSNDDRITDRGGWNVFLVRETHPAVTHDQSLH